MSKNVLIVDDEALVAFDLAATVEDLGHCVLGPAVTLNEGFACAEGTVPDAALLDIDVGGTPVWALARTLVAKSCSPIFVSANLNHTELATEFKGCARLDKPASGDEIAVALEQVLSARA